MKPKAYLASSLKTASLTLAASLLLLADPATAAVVTSNNLNKTAIPAMQTNKNMQSSSFATTPYQTYRLQGTVASTQTGNDVAGYNIMALSKGSVPAVTADLIQYVGVRTLAQPFAPTVRGFNLFTGNESATYYYNLGVGRYEAGLGAFSAWNYSWSATDLYLYGAKGVNGNVVPNASFEDTSVNFWQNGGAFVSAPGVHGSTVWEVTGVPTSYIALAVQPGVEYEFSFWSASPDIGYGHRIQYGFNVPANGWSATPADVTSIALYSGGGNRPWTEYTGTFTPGEGQTMWYLGGMVNGGRLQFDSIYLAQVVAIPEPGMAALVLVGGGIFWLRRRARGKA